MELIFLDEQFQNIGAPVDDYTSLQWIRRYGKCGQFTLHLSPSEYEMAISAAFIYNNAADETAIITSRQYISGPDEHIKLSGYMLEHMLTWRMPESPETAEGNLEQEIMRIVEKFAMSNERAIPKLELGAQLGIGNHISDQITNKSIGAWLYTALTPLGLSYKIHYDYSRDKLIFSLWSGKNRTQEQTENLHAVFSPEFENISDTEYWIDDGNYRNFAYISGKDAEGNPLLVTVDNITNSEYRREIAITPGGIKLRDDLGNPLSPQQIEVVLMQKGIEELARYKHIVKAAGELHDTPALAYRTGYDLGDLCDFAIPGRGLAFSARITQVTEVYEGERLSVAPVFGDDYLTIREMITRGQG